MNQEKTYYTCEHCGSDSFIKMYNVWNVEYKVEVGEHNGEETWDAIEIGVEKKHPIGYMCKECGKDAQELTDGL